MRSAFSALTGRRSAGITGAGGGAPAPTRDAPPVVPDVPVVQQQPQTIEPPLQEVTLVPVTELVLQGEIPPTRVTINGKIPVPGSNPATYQVLPGPAEIVATRLDEAGNEIETRTASVVFVQGQTALLLYSSMGVKQRWSTEQRMVVALLAATATAGAVYVLARRR